MLTMIDFAYPVSPPPVKTDIVLVYVGGDTPHPMTDAEMNSQPAKLRLPCWVRSDPTGSAQAGSEADALIKWLHDHKVPAGATVVLDLETAVNAAYVNEFNSKVSGAGYRLMKYGSLDYIFKNPKTSGGTFVADPTGKEHMITEGDTVATQYLFAATYDLSVVDPSVPLWDGNALDTTPVHTALATPSPKGSASGTYTLAIEWPAVANAEKYHVEVVNRNTMKPLYNEIVTGTSVTVPGLPVAVPSLFRVAADATAEHLASRWSGWVVVEH